MVGLGRGLVNLRGYTEEAPGKNEISYKSSKLKQFSSPLNFLISVHLKTK